MTAVSCPVPEHPQHGRVVYNSVTFNSLVSYECNYGYMVTGEANVFNYVNFLSILTSQKHFQTFAFFLLHTNYLNEPG